MVVNYRAGAFLLSLLIVLTLNASMSANAHDWAEDNNYHRLWRLEEFMNDLDADPIHGSFVKRYPLTDGSGNPIMTRGADPRYIYVLKISQNADAMFNDPNKADIVITGGHHAREWIGIEAAMRLADYLTDNADKSEEINNTWGNNRSVASILQNAEIFIVPVVNPEGFEWSYVNQAILDYDNRYWRKNRHPVWDTCNEPLCEHEGIGVDLCRNYPHFMWADHVTARPFPNYPMYPPHNSNCVMHESYWGTDAGSENEVIAIEWLFARLNVVAAIDFHSYGEVVEYPPGYAEDFLQPPKPGHAYTTPPKRIRPHGKYNDKDILERCAKKIRSIFPGVSWEAEQGFKVYQTFGTASDWQCETYSGHTLAFTIELGPGNPVGIPQKERFQPSDVKEISDSCRYPAMWLMLWGIDRSQAKTIGSLKFPKGGR